MRRINMRQMAVDQPGTIVRVKASAFLFAERMLRKIFTKSWKPRIRPYTKRKATAGTTLWWRIGKGLTGNSHGC
jgi:hypothetical protein